RIGRGALFMGSAIAYCSILIHHGLLLRRQQTYRERVAFIVSSDFDEAEIAINQGLWHRHLLLVGVVHDDSYIPADRSQLLGHVRDLPDIVRSENIHRVLCTSQ